jgi:hypothetical protein
MNVKIEKVDGSEQGLIVDAKRVTDKESYVVVEDTSTGSTRVLVKSVYRVTVQ